MYITQSLMFFHDGTMVIKIECSKSRPEYFLKEGCIKS